MPNLKRVEVPVKYNEDTSGIGYIEGYASTFDRVPDAYGDIVKKGAFTESLQHYYESGRSIPFLWSHQMNDLSSYIGICEAEEDDKGLHFIAKFDDTTEAQRIRQLYKDGRLAKFSFAYDTLESGPVQLENGVTANELRKLEIYEISAVLVPANSFAEVTDVKDINVSEKTGRRNSAADEQTIRNAIALLQEILGEVVDNAGSENDNEDNANADAKDQVIVNEKAQKLLDFINNM